MADHVCSIYPLKAADRAAKRVEHRMRLLAEAEERARKVGLSMKCAGEGMAVQHRTTVAGCANDGSSCLCECHDG